MEDLVAGRSATGTRAERRGIGEMEHIGGGTYRQTFDPDGPKADCWVYEDLVYINKRHVAAVGFDRDEMTMSPITYDEMRPGCYDAQGPAGRHGANWVEAIAVLPDVSPLLRPDVLEAKDKELAWRASWPTTTGWSRSGAATAAAGCIPLCLIPLWDAEQAAAEVRRNAARGVRAVCFSEIPPHLGLPSIHCGYWDPFFAACEDTGTVVCMHIGSSSKMPATSPDAPVGRGGDAQLRQRHVVAVRLLVLRRPRPLPRARCWPTRRARSAGCPTSSSGSTTSGSEHRAWGGVKDIVPEPPSTYYYRQVYGCFFRDQHGLDSLDVIGEDNVTFETDYPHTDSTWPDTRAVAEELVRDLSDPDVYTIMRGNAMPDAGPRHHVRLGAIVSRRGGRPLCMV